jgi:hypothetical protein
MRKQGILALALLLSVRFVGTLSAEQPSVANAAGTWKGV